MKVKAKSYTRTNKKFLYEILVYESYVYKLVYKLLFNYLIPVICDFVYNCVTFDISSFSLRRTVTFPLSIEVYYKRVF